VTAVPHRTRSGRVLTDADIERLAKEVATREFDVDELNERRRDRTLACEAAGCSPHTGPPLRDLTSGPTVA
jgi:hypothetical protein